MRIYPRDIERHKCLLLTGSEPWLDRIYGEFPFPAPGPQPLIRGQLNLNLLGDGTRVELEGELSFAPLIPCSGCNELIPWQIRLDLSDLFLPRPRNFDQPGERDLSPEDLDIYYFEADGSIDLEAYLNDQIQMAIPLRTSGTDQESTRGMCSCSLESEVSMTKNPLAPPKTNHPFAALEKLQDLLD